MSDNYYAPVTCHWVCTNATCAENGVHKDGYFDPPPGVTVTCGVCGRPCLKQALPPV